MDEPMNVLVLMCDHHRFDALGCAGNRLAKTPNLDKLASRSVRFENCFDQSPVCAPARHSLATGLYAHAHGVLSNRSMPFPGLVTIAHAVRPLGYRCFQLGHMHWTDRRMDTGYEPWITNEDWRKTMPKEVVDRCAWESQNITRRTTGGPSTRTREQYSGYYLANRAIEQISSAVDRNERFLCWMAFSEPHPPFYPPREVYEKIDQARIELPQLGAPGDRSPHDYVVKKRSEWSHLTEVEIRQMIAGYYGMIELADSYCGMVLDGLDDLGIRDRTIVIWTVDHGDQMWEHELFLKFVMYEGSVHVPLFVNVPGVSPAARPELVEHVDIVPTICELVGAECPAGVQGRSLVPLLDKGPTTDGWRDAVFSHMVGMADEHVQMVRTRSAKMIAYNGSPGEFYDLDKDPKELDNKVADPEYASAVQCLLQRLKCWEQANRRRT